MRGKQEENGRNGLRTESRAEKGKIASFLETYHLIPYEANVVIPFPPLRLSEFLVNRFLSRCDKRAHIL
jgi:hypothetical protein